MLKHQTLVKWEKRLKKVFDRIDDFLENKYGDLYPLHPRRAKRGATSNKEHDGLFNVGASYSLGGGSVHGKGYVVEVRMATLAHVPDEIRAEIGSEVAAMLGRELKEAFPERKLKVERDGDIYKITGDFSLGPV